MLQELKDFKPVNENDWRYSDELRVWLPRVTKVLSLLSKGKFFENWLKDKGKEADALLTTAGDRGVGQHNICEKIGKGERVDLTILTDPHLRWTEAFLDWSKKNVRRFINTEETVYHPDELYIGTLDAFVQLSDGRLAVLDYKTGRYIYDTYLLQTVAYLKAKEKLLGHSIDTAIILRFEKDQMKKIDLETEEVVDIDYQWEVFKDLLKVFYWKQFYWLKRRKNAVS